MFHVTERSVYGGSEAPYRSLSDPCQADMPGARKVLKGRSNRPYVASSRYFHTSEGHKAHGLGFTVNGGKCVARFFLILMEFRTLRIPARIKHFISISLFITLTLGSVGNVNYWNPYITMGLVG